MRVSRTVPTTLTEAKRVESKLLQELIHGKFEILKKSHDPKFKEYAEEYLKTVTWQKSFSRTELSVQHLVRFFGNKRLTEITTQDFINYRIERLRSVSVATVNRERSAMLRMLNLAIKDEGSAIQKNPLTDVKQFKEPPAENRMLTKDEYFKLLKAAPEYFRRIIFMACNTGMRKMEILDLQFGQVRIWPGGGGEIELLDTKSDEKEYVPLNDDVVDMIIMIAQERNIDVFNMKEKDREKFVFLSKYRKKLLSVRKPMYYTFSKAGIDQRPFHTFRHFWTKMMFEAGNDPATIQKVGRWRDFETMLRYCYTTREEEQAAVRKLSLKLKDQTPKKISLRQYSGNKEN
jgi:integrase